MTEPHVDSICRYPVKGLTAERLAAADLRPGAPIDGDRAYAIENGAGRFDPDNPKPLPKISFLMLMRNERLATLETRFDGATTTLTILRAGKPVVTGNLGSRIGRQMIEQFLAAYMKGDLRGAPRIVHADGHHFADHPEPCLHIVNLATVSELERVARRALDPLRFRANIYVGGLPAWEEFRWVGQPIGMGGARLEVFERTGRCEATNVDPLTGKRDLAIPQHLQRAFGHADLGVYARVIAAGTIRTGDPAGLL